MPTYITLLHYTQHGIEKMKDSPTRLAAAKQSVRAMGGELKAFYLTMGQYDAVVVSEAPDENRAGTSRQPNLTENLTEAFTRPPLPRSRA